MTMNSNSFVSFPRHRIVREGVNELGVFQENSRKAMKKFVDSVVDEEVIAIQERLTMTGIGADSERFNTYFPVIAEMLRQCCYDLIDLKHPNGEALEFFVQNLYEEPTNDPD